MNGFKGRPAPPSSMSVRLRPLSTRGPVEGFNRSFVSCRKGWPPLTFTASPFVVPEKAGSLTASLPHKEILFIAPDDPTKYPDCSTTRARC